MRERASESTVKATAVAMGTGEKQTAVGAAARSVLCPLVVYPPTLIMTHNKRTTAFRSNSKSCESVHWLRPLRDIIHQAKLSRRRAVMFSYIFGDVIANDPSRTLTPYFKFGCGSLLCLVCSWQGLVSAWPCYVCGECDQRQTQPNAFHI